MIKTIKGFVIGFMLLLPFLIAGVGGFVIYFALFVLVGIVEAIRQNFGATNTMWDAPPSNGFD